MTEKKRFQMPGKEFGGATKKSGYKAMSTNHSLLDLTLARGHIMYRRDP